MPQLKVLVPLDGSEFAERALTILPALAGLGDAYVRLIGAVDTEELEALPRAQEWIAREERLLRSHLEMKQTQLQSDGVLAGWEVQEGRPAQVILTAAHRFHPDLLIISTHGRSGIERWRLGSVADKVIRAAEWDTLVVGPAAVPNRTAVRQILLPLDGSKLAESGLPIALELAKSLEARLHIVRVAAQPTFADEAGWAWRAVQDAAQAYLVEMAQMVDNQEVVTAMPLGRPADELLKYIQQHHIDLTVMTSHGRSGFLRTALGSTTDALIGSRTPVLVVKPASRNDTSSI